MVRIFMDQTLCMYYIYYKFSAVDSRVWGCQSTPGIWGFRKGAKPDFCLSEFTTNTPEFKKLSMALSLE